MYPILILCFLFVTIFIPAQADAGQNLWNTHNVLKTIDDLWRGQSSQSVVTMRIKTSHWERKMILNVYTKGIDNSLIRIVKPLKEQGVSTLKVGSEVYNYLPKIDRTIKLTTAMMSGNWMGSHFTNDDLVRESRISEDYDPEISFVGNRDGQNITEITLKPKSDAAVVWGKIVLTVRDDKMPVREVYYDEDGKVVRELRYYDYQWVSGRLVPMHLKMIPQDKPEEFTEINFHSLAFNIPYPKDFFSLHALKR